MTLREQLKEELDELTKEKIIENEEIGPEWVNNILIARKRDSFRIY